MSPDTRMISRLRDLPRRAAGPGSWLDRMLSVGVRRRATVIGLTVVLVLAMVAAVWLTVVQLGQRQVESARVEGLRAASESATVLLSYDYRTLDDDLAKADTVTTGDFAGQYRDLSAQLIKPNAVAQQIVTTARVTGSSVVSATSDRVVALLFLNQETTGKDAPARRIDRSRAQVTMTEAHGRWLISELKPV